jgi:ABC-type lipoprotein export system ATPase subunit
MAAIRLDTVTRSFGAITALRGVSLEVAEEERVAILGKSGSGKSTLLHLLAGLDRPTSGTVSVFGEELGRLSSAGLAEYRLRRVGVIFQAFHLISTRSTLENVEMPLTLAGVPPVERRRRVLDALAAVGLEHRLGHLPTQLSGGEQQRAAIARALIHGPRLLLCDEPTGNLDSVNAAAVMSLLLAQAQGATALLVTHDEELAGRFAHRIVRLRDGEVVP